MDFQNRYPYISAHKKNTISYFRSVPQSSSNYMPSMYQPTMSSLTSNQVGNVHNLHSHGPSPPSHGPPGKPS